MVFTTIPFRDREITVPINPQMLIPENFQDWDADGFELTLLETLYYRINGFELNNRLRNVCCQRDWFLDDELAPFVVVDHALLLERYKFSGDAKQQLIDATATNCHLIKPLMAKSKWGFDLSIQWITHTSFTEVLHIEQDFDNIQQAQDKVDIVQLFVNQTDWLHAARTIEDHYDQWKYLSPIAQANWKANFFGFGDVAEITRKTAG